MFDQRTVTAIVPARNEEASIGVVLRELTSIVGTDGTPIVDRMIVCDNASTDQTAKIAKLAGAEVVFENRPGYSFACHGALNHFFEFDHNNNDILFFIDADQSMRLTELPTLLHPLASGADIVIGSRVGPQSAAGALNLQQRWGNRLATFLIRRIWQVDISDLGPFRAVTAEALKQIDMQDQTYGWTTEMQVRAIQEELRMIEVPVSALVRVGRSKISGSLIGNIRAGRAILGTILKLWWKERGLS